MAAGLRAAARARTAETALRGDEPFIMQADGKAGCSRPAGLVDGPLPDALRAAGVAGRQPALRRSRPTRRASSRRRATRQPVPPRAGAERLPVRDHDLPADRAPHGGRHVALAALAGRAAARDVLRGLARAGRASAGSSTAAGRRSSPTRAAIEARVLVTERMHAAARRRPRRSTRSGCPTTGARAASRPATRPTTCSSLALDPNVHIQEFKAATCDVRPGAGRAARRWSSSSTTTAAAR